MIDHHNLAIELIAALRMQPYALTGDLIDRADSAKALDRASLALRIAAKKSARNLATLAALLTAQTFPSDEKSKPVARIELYAQKQVEGSETRHLRFVAHADVALDGALIFAPDADLAEALKVPCFGKICLQDAPAAEAARHHPISVLEGGCFIEDVVSFYKEALSSVGREFQAGGADRVFVVKGVNDQQVVSRSGDARESLTQLPVQADLPDDCSQEAVHRFAEQRLIAALLSGVSEPDFRGLSSVMARYEARLVDKQVLFDEAKDFLSSLDPESSAAIKLAGLLEPLVEQQPLAERPRGG